MADSETEEFKLGAGRLAKLKEALTELARNPSTSPRKLARMAGLLASSAPAILPVALYSRSFYNALSGRESWDAIFPTPKAVQETAVYWLSRIDRWNGRRWWPRPVAVKAEIDASEVGFGGRVILPGNETLTVRGTFTGREAAQSSTEREVIGYARALEVITKFKPELIQGRSVLLIGDSQAGLAAVGKFRSTVPLIESALKEILELCAKSQCDVITRWVPRTELTEADAPVPRA